VKHLISPGKGGSNYKKNTAKFILPVQPSQFMVLSRLAVDKHTTCELKNYSE
jgi:hypothetical protein